MLCRTKKSSTYLHLMMHMFMVHGVDPLVEQAINSLIILGEVSKSAILHFILNGYGIFAYSY
jgi:hypothetical protein